MLCAWRRAQLPALVLPPLLPGLAGRDDALGVLLRVLAALVGTLLAKLLFKQLAWCRWCKALHELHCV